MQPKLRFKDYSADWQSMTLNSVSEQIGDGLHSTPVYDPDGEFFFINGNNLVDGQIKITESTKRLNHIEIQKHKIRLSSNCILMSINGTIGNLAFYQNQKILLGKSACYIDLKEGISKQFIYQLLQSPSLKKSFTGELTGSTIKNLSLGTIRDTIFFSPDKSEVTKIASFLSVVDEKIKQLTKSHELLTHYKQGVMRKIFNQELRFKANDGGDYSDWKTECFGNIYSFKTTNSLSRECLNYEGGTIKNIHYGDIHTKYRSRFSIKNELVPFINSDVDLSKIRADCYCEEGDLIIADASEDYADIGKCIEIINLGEQKLLAGLHTFLAKPKKNSLGKGYMSYAMQSFKVRHQVKVIAQGTKVLSLSATRLSDVLIPIPDSEEQSKIANFLLAIDDKIHNAKSQLEATKQYKQGLLQQMFV